MMRKYELSITPDYVSSWTVVDAVRELFQNAIDQQATHPECTMRADYDGEACLRIASTGVTLKTSTLLFGSSSKRSDAHTIGKFGEGYKIASLVLTRLGKQVTLYNYGAREVWKARLMPSLKYGVDILTFLVYTKKETSFLPDNDLTIEVKGITNSEWVEIVESNLHLQDIEEECIIETPMGRILKAPSHKGKVFVNGLFVTHYTPYEFGYDFKPEHIKLDRDRKLVSDFDLKWLSSRMWNCVDSTEEIIDLAKDGAPDIQYLTESGFDSSHKEEVQLTAHKEFVQDYGDRAVPVSAQYEADVVPKGYKPIIVPEAYKKLIVKASSYEEPEEPKLEGMRLSDRFNWWMEKYGSGLGRKATNDFEDLVDELKEMEADVDGWEN